MAIDGIRKGGTPVVGPTRSDEAHGASAPTKSFDVSGAAELAGAAKAEALSSLAMRVRSGELDLAAFVDAKIEQSTSHLKLSPEALSDVKDMMRDKMMSDPLVVDWISELTGARAKKDE